MRVEELCRVDAVRCGMGPAEVPEYAQDKEEGHVGDGFGGCGGAVAVEDSCIIIEFVLVYSGRNERGQGGMGWGYTISSKNIYIHPIVACTG